ncbi:D-glycero-beta-D-manno-heptose 1-phosphate adenylyltransferase [Micromonospora sp. NBC_01796]|uniref:D-glycero-beta-D-manno-heptose 1-phosphate adenylyltransferase n=1 Tax=Micromonospora sp. NBC_01796 TaxID=2975987 RepID=UPI002DD92AED|nr:D-glycero-beta-D-manno-heptose 1-phosphate adenylyltransferase [Micromonospora sp. NBC_01796]WSA88036.1 D-glycero-beta-D-manno-heptose 1-phosphate adenylyltransferase [Micromonospora sp. NBC_01796]
MVTGAEEDRRLADVVESWLGRGVLVVGDAMLDEWRFADSDRLCREAPAPVLTLRRRITAAGGAANTAVNLSALGGRASLVAPVGADVAGDELHDCLDRAGVWDRTVSQTGRRTPVKRRILAADQILVREDEGDRDDRLCDDGVQRLLGTLASATEELREVTGQPPTLVICDYGLGALPEPIRAWLVEHRDLFGTVALDAHDLAYWRGLAPTVVTPSFAEATRLLNSSGTTAAAPADPPAEAPAVRLAAGQTPTVEMPTVVTEVVPPLPERPRGFTESTVHSGTDRAGVARSHLAEIRERTGADVVAVTLDTDGAVVGGPDGEPRRSHATPVPASYAVGAGDAYLAAMTLALAAGAPLPTAARLAQLAATSTVAGMGTCVCVREDLLAALGSTDGDGERAPAVVDHGGLDALIARHRRDGRSVVFTNGCFDVLHRGHVRYLDQARQLGDVLVVAVNSDDSVRRLKGADRPVNPVEDRVAVLAALACVDHVVVFEEDSPAALIETVRPDVYVKGGDYPPEMVPEAPLVRRLGGQVRTLGYVPDRSTSAIIDRIRSQTVNGRAPATSDAQEPSLADSPTGSTP